MLSTRLVTFFKRILRNFVKCESNRYYNIKKIKTSTSYNSHIRVFFIVFHKILICKDAYK